MPLQRPLRRLAAGLAVGLGFGIALAAVAAAQGSPSKPVTLVVPFAAGGTVDKVARRIQEPLRARLGQPLIIDNKGGAGGTIGMAAVAKSAPDGYTVALVVDSYATEQHIYPKLPYTTLRDLTGVSYVARSPMVLVVPVASPYRTLPNYVAAAKKPGTVTYASVGAGSSNHLAAELFHETAGTSGVHVPFKGGGPALTDLLGGHVDSMIASLPLVLQQVQAGKLRALAVTSRKRTGALPDVPTVAESYKGFEVYSWVGMVAPAKTPAPVLDRLAADMTATPKAIVLCTPQQRGQAEQVADLLGAQAASIFDGAVMHVPIESARAARRFAAQQGADCAVAVGGGSTIGLGKAIAFDSALPILAIPTTYAGSEMTPIYGLTEDGLKRTGRDVRVLPRTVIYDPQLTLGLPLGLSVVSGVNAIAHAVQNAYEGAPPSA